VQRFALIKLLSCTCVHLHTCICPFALQLAAAAVLFAACGLLGLWIESNDSTLAGVLMKYLYLLRILYATVDSDMQYIISI
jgi:hypothetical protein